jgi:hypothetical protein
MKNCGHHGIRRRHFLFGSAASAASVGLLQAHPDAEVAAGPAATTRNTARSCIFINLNGAPSQLDTFDAKDGPWNPPGVDIRQYGQLQMSRRLYPTLSTLTNDFCVIRSAASKEAAHERGQYTVQTGHPFNPAISPEVPHVGAVISRERATGGKLPPFLALNANGLRGPAFLGGQFSPLATFPTREGVYTLQHNFYGEASAQIFGDKFELLSTLDAPLRRAPYSQSMADYTAMYDQARQMMYDPSIDAVFKFSLEDERRYGANPFGNALVTARNAIRAKNGAVFVWTSLDGWDAHYSMFDNSLYTSYYRLSSQLDTGLSNLIQDLKASGDFASTLIVVMGEFGRTPGVLNSRDGRDHYKEVMSVLLAGGGVRGGRVIGTTDREARTIVTPGWRGNRPIFVEDVMATIYSALGIDWTKSISDTPSGRRFSYLVGAAEGEVEPVNEVFGA